LLFINFFVHLLSTTSPLHSLLFIVLKSLSDPLHTHLCMVPKHWYAYPVVAVAIVRIDPNANAVIKKTANILQMALDLLCS